MMFQEDDLAISAATAAESVAVESWRKLLSRTPFLDINPNTQRLASMIFHNLRNAEEVPERDRLRGAYKHTWSKNLQLISAFLPIVEELNTENINYRVLKGVAVQLLTGILGARVVGDIDVVVASVDLARTTAVFEKHGFRCSSRAACGFHSVGASDAALDFNRGDMQIDLHVAERKEPSRLFASMLSTPALFVPIRETRIAVPSAEALTLHAVLHGYRSASQTDLVQALTDAKILRPMTEELTLSRLARTTGLRGMWRKMELTPHHTGKSSTGDVGLPLPAIPSSHKPRPELSLSRLRRGLTLLRERYPGLKVIGGIISRFQGRKFAYALWLVLGRFEDVERVLVRKRGFLDPPLSMAPISTPVQPFASTPESTGFTASLVSARTIDYRLCLRLPGDLVDRVFTLSSPNLRQVDVAVYVNGQRISRLLVGDNIPKAFSLPNGVEVFEISLRPARQACQLCFVSLRDLEIRFLVP